MQESWAKIAGQASQAGEAGQAGQASVDLHLDLPGPHGSYGPRGFSGSRVRLGLETALRDAVRTGRLGPGTRLPSSRALAADLGLARNTVAEVYSQLVAEGWLTARTGSGTSVAERRTADPARDRWPAPRSPLRVTTCGRVSRTWPPSRAAPGWPRRAGCSPPPPASCWATQIPGGSRS